MELKYAIFLILLGYIVFIAGCWKFCIKPKMKYLSENQYQPKNRVVPEARAMPVVPKVPDIV